METITAGNDLVITAGIGAWQLYSRHLDQQPLFTAAAGTTVFRYPLLFAEARHLPAEGSLAYSAVQEVVVGWSHADKAWHLGLLLGPDVAEARGGRWCELANWPDEYALRAADQAEQAGKSLVAVIQRPFRFVEAPHLAPATGPLNPNKLQAYVPPPVTETMSGPTPAALPASAPAAAPPSTPEADDMAGSDWMKPTDLPEPPPAPRSIQEKRPDELYARAAQMLTSGQYASAVAVPDADVVATADQTEIEMPMMRVSRPQRVPIELPLHLGGWTLRPISGGLQWAHTGVWSLGTIWRIIFRFAVGIMFVVLSVFTLQSQYAPVQPEWLPLLGLVIGVGLIINGLSLTMSMLRTEAVVIDTEKRQIRRHLDLTSDVVDVYGFDEVQAVVVTQVAQQRHRGRNGQPDRMSHEAWLHLLLHEAHQERGKYRRLKPEDAYVTIGHIDIVDGEITPEHFMKRQRRQSPQPLVPEAATTPAHQAGLVLAQSIGAEVYIDQR